MPENLEPQEEFEIEETELDEVAGGRRSRIGRTGQA